jgi:predicted metal-dependent peptidase
MTDTKTKISAARYIAIQQVPYFGQALFKTVFRPVPLGTMSEIGTLAMTNKGVILYEAEAIERWSERQLAAVIIHELNHLIRQHGKRCGDRDPKTWNMSCDREINDDLQAMRLPLPDVPLVPEQINMARGLTAEEYFEHENQGKDGNQGQQQGPGAGACGSCAGGDGDENEDEHGQSDRTDVEMKAMRDQVAADIQDFARKGRGSVPAGLARWANAQLTPPKIPWEQRLARICRNAVVNRPGAVDYSYSVISRRQAGVGYGPGMPILPGLVEPIPCVGVGLDTSGSMGQDEIMRGATETAGILKAVGADIQFVACDSEVHGVKKISSVKEMAALIKGGGGTDFVPIFDAVEKMNPRPEVFVMITDGDGPAPAQPPRGVQVIWLLVGPYRRKPYSSRGKEVTYGSFIEIDD